MRYLVVSLFACACFSFWCYLYDYFFMGHLVRQTAYKSGEYWTANKLVQIRRNVTISNSVAGARWWQPLKVLSTSVCDGLARWCPLLVSGAHPVGSRTVAYKRSKGLPSFHWLSWPCLPRFCASITLTSPPKMNSAQVPYKRQLNK